jgi:hypothetical protein
MLARHSGLLTPIIILRDQRPGELLLKASLGNSSEDHISTNKKLSVMAHTCHPSYAENTNDCGPGQLRHKHETLFENS